MIDMAYSASEKNPVLDGSNSQMGSNFIFLGQDQMKLNSHVYVAVKCPEEFCTLNVKLELSQKDVMKIGERRFLDNFS